MNTSKRKRSVNFTRQESRILVDIVLKHQKVIENKQSDCVAWTEKKDAWSTIEKEFNNRSGQCFRSAQVLHAKYETIKKDIRKKAAAIKRCIFMTGGGSENIPEYLDFEEKLLGVIYLSVEGLPSIGDSDEVNNNEIVEVPDQEKEIYIDVTSTATLIQPTAQEIICEPTNTMEILTIASTSADEAEITPKHENSQIITQPPACQVNPQPSTSQINTQPPTKEKRKWTPNFLKSQKSPALQVKKKNTDTIQDKFSKLAEAKNEMMGMQKEIQNAELKFKEKQFEIKQQILEQELQNVQQLNEFNKIIHKKKMELLNIKILCNKRKLEMLEK